MKNVCLTAAAAALLLSGCVNETAEFFKQQNAKNEALVSAQREREIGYIREQTELKSDCERLKMELAAAKQSVTELEKRNADLKKEADDRIPLRSIYEVYFTNNNYGGGPELQRRYLELIKPGKDATPAQVTEFISRMKQLPNLQDNTAHSVLLPLITENRERFFDALLSNCDNYWLCNAMKITLTPADKDKLLNAILCDNGNRYNGLYSWIAPLLDDKDKARILAAFPSKTWLLHLLRLCNMMDAAMPVIYRELDNPGFSNYEFFDIAIRNTKDQTIKLKYCARYFKLFSANTGDVWGNWDRAMLVAGNGYLPGLEYLVKISSTMNDPNRFRQAAMLVKDCDDISDLRDFLKKNQGNIVFDAENRVYVVKPAPAPKSEPAAAPAPEKTQAADKPAVAPAPEKTQAADKPAVARPE
ncbi:MAG: hypothetical protein PHI35_09295 [Victivallaceae bacterium]|nr:hypothetical protein [Victivallaceae bacterium]